MGTRLRRLGDPRLALFLTALATLPPSGVRAYINQADGTIVPQTGRLQACLDLAATAETTPGAVNAVADAAILPEAFRPVPNASGSYDVTFVDIAEGAGYRNSFGWFWIGEDVTDPRNLRTIFDCRTYSACACPCTTTRTVTIDFDTQPGFAPGRPIGFWLRTPERIDGSGSDPDNCGDVGDTANRIYFTSQALNDDGDYIHFLVYRSATRTHTFYFGFEDLWRGGDNDFEDMLVRATGLVPTCDPRPETCNNLDDDCDLRVDEGLTMACSTACGSGTRTCVAGSFGACSARVPTSETCNGVDDDCDGSTDEGLSRPCSNACGSGTEICIGGTFAMCTAPAPAIETCNGVDDDCDGRVDESLTRACVSACGSGTETCTMGRYAGCTAPTPSTEVCNAADDDCDGRVDEGLVRDCTNACGTGLERCVAGAFVGCTAPAPRIEACNGVDDDCDGRVDEMLTQACSSECGVGSERCVMGAWVGCDAPTPSTEVCNNVDDDCDGVIDDGNPGGGGLCMPLGDGGFTTDGRDGGMPDGGGIVCMNGRVLCVEGALVCRGATTGSREVCNCLDDDCDGRVDEDPMGTLCPGGACLASECACVDPCASEEFPCPPERICDRTLAEPERGIIGYCVRGRCAGVTCGDEEVCNPETGACENVCMGITCAPGFACVRGACIEDNCYGRGCPFGEICRTTESGAPACQPDRCAGVACGSGEFCRDGVCVPACLEGCPAGEICESGVCVPAPCGGRCSPAQTCVDGTCVDNRCTPPCGRRRVCRIDRCVDDPCAGVACPDGTVCRAGSCTRAEDAPPPPRRGLATGGGGCVCTAAGARAGGPGVAAVALLAALGVALAVRRRRSGSRLRRRLSGRAGVRAGIAVASVLSGCNVDPYCFTGCDDAGARDAGVDARIDTDGCVAAGEEICNERDDDCDGAVDEGFDVRSDPRNCGTCNTTCMLPHAFPACREGECAIDRCEIGWHDIDGTPANGCEYRCPPSGDELCDEADNDCDARIDEGFDLRSDLANCGRCGHLCAFPNASARCEDGRCVMGECRVGFVDLDGDRANGCEYRCTPSGAEMCNGVDDDCDRRIDEGFDLAGDPMNCGACGRVCSFPQARARCAAGVCTFGPGDCEAGWHDVDGIAATGCEYMCTPVAGADVCDGVDQDCDGRVDEADPAIGTPCGTDTGACERGRQACVRGRLTCAGAIGPAAESCNGIDDDCDGRTDESTAAEPIPGVGDRCGATNLGRCEYGQVICSGGTLVCGGTWVGPTAETCNGVDDDCNGAIDDRLTPPPASSVPSCAEMRGVCAGRTPTCRGAMGWGCDLPPTYQAVETRCDGLDNDCDGLRDEGCLQPVGSDVRLDTQDAPSSYNSLHPAIIGTGSGSSARLQVVWRDLSGGTRARIYESRSTDGGASWTAPRRLDTTSGPTFRPRIALAGTNVIWAWPDFRGGTSYREIWTRRSTDSGATLQPEVRVNPGSVLDAYNVVTATAGSNVYVAWEAFTGARRRHVFFSRSTDGGATWSTPLQLPTPSGATYVAAEPRIAASGPNVYVVWRDNRSGSLDIYLRRSNDFGASFAAEQRIDVGTPAGSSASFSADVAANGSAAWVVWVDDRDGGSFDVWMNRTSDSGATWLSSAVRLDADPLRHDSIEPRVVSPAPGTVIVAWIDYRSGFPDILATRSTTGGATWSEPERLDTGTMPGASGSYELDIAANGNLVVAVWSDDRAGLLDVYANYSLDGGATWQPQDYRMDTSPLGSSDSQDPAVWAAPNAFHVVWVDHRRGSACPFAGTTDCANGDIFYRRVQ